MQIIQNMMHFLTDWAGGVSIFSGPSQVERAARAEHDRQVADMARRLDDEMAIRMGQADR